MVCAGCNEKISQPVAFAIMHQRDVPKGTGPAVKGSAEWVGMPMCLGCFVDPSIRKNKIKAHFALPEDIKRLLGAAGSSTGIG